MHFTSRFLRQSIFPPLKLNCKIFSPLAIFVQLYDNNFHWFWSLNFYCRPELWWWWRQQQKKCKQWDRAELFMRWMQIFSLSLPRCCKFPCSLLSFFPSRSPLFLCDFNWHRENCDVNMKLNSAKWTQLHINEMRWAFVEEGV